MFAHHKNLNRKGQLQKPMHTPQMPSHGEKENRLVMASKSGTWRWWCKQETGGYVVLVYCRDHIDFFRLSHETPSSYKSIIHGDKWTTDPRSTISGSHRTMGKVRCHMKSVSTDWWCRVNSQWCYCSRHTMVKRTGKVTKWGMQNQQRAGWAQISPLLFL